MPGESHGQRNLAGYSLWGCKDSDTTEATEHACTLIQQKKGRGQRQEEGIRHLDLEAGEMKKRGRLSLERERLLEKVEFVR